MGGFGEGAESRVVGGFRGWFAYICLTGDRGALNPHLKAAGLALSYGALRMLLPRI